MKVYVIMGNDYPNGVMVDRKKAEDLCLNMMNEQKKENEGKSLHNQKRVIYWRAYEFELDEDVKDV